MGMVQEFKEFALKGNVMDLAVGVIIGVAFGKIVDSVVNDLVMPVVSRFTGGLDFSNLFIPLRELPPDLPHTLEAVTKAGIPVFAYGHFITVAINFVILAFIIFQIQGHEPAEEVLAGRPGRDAGGRGPPARNS